MIDNSLKILLFSNAGRAEGGSRWAWDGMLRSQDIHQDGGLAFLACPQNPLSCEISTSLRQLCKIQMYPFVKCLPPAAFLPILKVLNFIFTRDWEALILRFSQRDWPINRFIWLQLSSGDMTKNKTFHPWYLDKYFPCAWECPGDISAQFFSREPWQGVWPRVELSCLPFHG